MYMIGAEKDGSCLQLSFSVASNLNRTCDIVRMNGECGVFPPTSATSTTRDTSATSTRDTSATSTRDTSSDPITRRTGTNTFSRTPTLLPVENSSIILTQNQSCSDVICLPNYSGANLSVHNYRSVEVTIFLISNQEQALECDTSSPDNPTNLTLQPFQSIDVAATELFLVITSADVSCPCFRVRLAPNLCHSPLPIVSYSLWILLLSGLLLTLVIFLVIGMFCWVVYKDRRRDKSLKFLEELTKQR